MSTDARDLLPEADLVFLNEKHPDARVYGVGQEVHVLFPAFAFPNGYQPTSADLLIRLPAGYPDVKPDMFWTRPDIKLVNGAWPAASEHHEVPGTGNGSDVYQEIAWQRWSRHTNTLEWRPGIDGLRSYLATVKRELSRQI